MAEELLHLSVCFPRHPPAHFRKFVNIRHVFTMQGKAFRQPRQHAVHPRLLFPANKKHTSDKTCLYIPEFLPLRALSAICWLSALRSERSQQLSDFPLRSLLNSACFVFKARTSFHLPPAFLQCRLMYLSLLCKMSDGSRIEDLGFFLPAKPESPKGFLCSL